VSLILGHGVGQLHKNFQTDWDSQVENPEYVQFSEKNIIIIAKKRCSHESHMCGKST